MNVFILFLVYNIMLIFNNHFQIKFHESALYECGRAHIIIISADNIIGTVSIR